jgi:hypothetical protein
MAAEGAAAQETRMCDLIEVPGVGEIEDAPQSAVLSVVEHALGVASTCLEVEHPCLGQLGESYEGRLPPRQQLLAQLIVDRCRELSGLISWYRRSCPRALSRHQIRRDDQDEDEPF